MDRPPGLNRSMSLDQFEEATTTIACLREFLVACIEDIGGTTVAWRSTRGRAFHGPSTAPFASDEPAQPLMQDMPDQA